jgi:hypothetical protein
MTRTLEQNAADLEIAKMRLDQARDKLCDAISIGDDDAMDRIEKVHAAAIQDYRDLMSERAFMNRHEYA